MTTNRLNPTIDIADLDCAHDDRTLRFEWTADPSIPAPRPIFPLAGSAHWDCDDCGVTFLGPLDEWSAEGALAMGA